MKRTLLISVTKKDLEITYFSGKGAGGQHRNKHQNCVRIKHPPSKVITTGQGHRSLDQNKKEAFVRLANHPKFRTWLRVESARASMDLNELKKQINREVDRQVQDKNLKVEYYTP